MDMAAIIVLTNIIIYLSIAGLGIYTIILLIKALKIYIKNNS